MSSFHRIQPALMHCVFAALTLFALTACESDRAQRGHRGSEDAEAAPDKAVPEMEAHGTFFAGQIEVETLLNRAGFAGRSGGKDEGASGGGDSGGGGGGGSFGGGGGGFGGGGGGHRRGGGSGGNSTAGTGDSSDSAPRIRPSNLPAVRLHLRLTNHGAGAVEAEVADFESDLGNFVVEPSKIQLPPGKPVEAEPMTSRLGVTSDTIPLTVSLLVNGRTETQVLSLQTVIPAPPPAPTPPAPTP
jgi:hypothetical protein